MRTFSELMCKDPYTQPLGMSELPHYYERTHTYTFDDMCLIKNGCGTLYSSQTHQEA